MFKQTCSVSYRVLSSAEPRQVLSVQADVWAAPYLCQHLERQEGMSGSNYVAWTVIYQPPADRPDDSQVVAAKECDWGLHWVLQQQGGYNAAAESSTNSNLQRKQQHRGVRSTAPV